MDILTIAGKPFKAVDIDFNYLADLVDAGLSPESIGEKGLSALRIYVAACAAETYRAPIDIREAGKLINEHIIKGGELTDLLNVFTKKCEESDFFRALTKRTEETAPKNTAAAGKKKTTKSKVTAISEASTETAE